MRRAVVAAVVVGCGSSPAVPPDAPPDAAPDAAAVPQLVLDPVATGIADPTVLALDASDVYFVHGGDSISRVAKAGGAVAPIASGQKGPGSLDATTENLVWVCAGTHANDFLDGSVRWLPKAGGTETELAAATLPSAVAVDLGGTTVFWVEVDGQRVRQIQLDGTDERTIDASATHKTSLAITPSRLAWTATGDSADVVTFDRPLVMAYTLSTVEYSPGSVVIDGDDVYWTERHPGSDLGAIRVARGGGLASDLVSDEYAPTALVRDDRHLYWASNGRIRRIARAGGTAVTISDGRGAIGALALDATHLYWTETTHGAIVRAIK
jgi:hypothetical protein